MENELHDSADRTAIRRALLNWFQTNARALPWKENISAYRVWISEIMLQQTQVGTVLDSYFSRFIERFPTVTSLAKSDEQSVLQLWEGLGYYSRARNIYKAAQVLADKYNGEFPRDAASVESLPGIGRYTAGAILSIAYNLPVPILEANTVRIHARLLGINAPTESKAIQNILWEAAKQILDKKSPGTINQALMQFGQQVCKKRPLCDQCPISQYCQAKRQGLENSIPIPKIKPKTIFWRHGAVVIYDKQNRIYLRCHLPGEHWAGLWDFPRVDLDSIQTDTKNPVESLVQSQFGLKIRLISPDPFLSIEHAVTNHKISLDCFLGVIQESGKTDKAAEGQVWIPAEKLKDYPLSSTGRKIADKINQIDRIKV